MKYDARTLIEEADKAEEIRGLFLESLEELHQRYHGRAYRGDCNGEYNPDNHEHNYVSHMIPQIAYENPRVGGRGRAGQISRLIARAMQMGLNKWAEDERLCETNQKVCLDGLFSEGIFLTTNDSSDPNQVNDFNSTRLPKVRRLSPYQFLRDPKCSDVRFAKWLGHDDVYDLDDLREMAEADMLADPTSGWNLDLINRLQATDDEIPWRDDELSRTGPERDEIVVREIWCPGYFLPGFTPEDGYHGTIFTIAKGQEGKDKDEWIREPRPYWGPPWGPYTLFGVHDVPELPYKLGPLVVQKPEADAVNDIGRVIDQGANSYKRVTIADGSAADVAMKHKAAKSGDTIIAKGFNPQNMQDYETGGITDQQIAVYQFRRQRLDRISSMSETLRGNSVGSKTATAESIASEANQITVGFFRQQFVKAVQQVVDTAGWYLYNDRRAKITLGEDAAAELGIPSPAVVGDPQAIIGAQLGLDGPAPIGQYRDVVEITVEPDSMNMVTSSMQRAQGLEMLDRVVPMLQAMPQTPWMPWKDIGEYLADLYNNDTVGDWFAKSAQISAQFAGLPGAVPGQTQLQYQGVGNTAPAKQPTGFQGRLTGPLQMSPGGFMAQNRPMEGKVAGESNPMQGAA